MQSSDQVTPRKVNILIIISEYLPSQTPNTLRWHPLIEKLSSENNVNILTTKSRQQALVENNNITIYRAGHNTLLDFVTHYLKRSKRRNIVGNTSKKPSITKRFLEKMVDLVWRKNYWPDGSVLFLKPGRKKGSEIIKSKKITHVISVGLPFTCHWIAKHLKEQNPELTWLMDIQDPFCYSEEFWVNNFKKYKSKNINAEKDAFELADYITVTNHAAKSRYADMFPDNKNKLSIIPPLFSTPKKSTAELASLEKSKIHLGYFGSFYTGVRSPKMFLELLSQAHKDNVKNLTRLKFHFIGQVDHNSIQLFNKNPQLLSLFTFHGFVGRDEGLSMMSQMDFLVNFGNTTDYHLPSKVVDYLYLNKPIVNFISRGDDSSKLFWAGKAVVENVALHSDEKPLVISSLINFVLTKHEQFDPHKELESFSLESIYRKYYDLLSKNNPLYSDSRRNTIKK